MGLTARKAVSEAAKSSLAHRATSFVLLLVTLAMTVTVFLTAGRAAAAEAQILASVDNAGPRLISVNIADPSPGVDQAGLDRLASMDGIEWVLGLGAARDVRSGLGGQRINVAAREILTPLPDLVTMDLGREPRGGEAIVSAKTQKRLQLVEPAGWLVDDGQQRAVVGRFSSSGVIADLERLVLIAPTAGEESPHATLIYILASDALGVDAVVRQVRALAGVFPADALSVKTSDALVALSGVLTGQVGSFSRQLALGVVAVGMVLLALTMTLALNSRRRDFGRRRALGASRSALVAVALVEAAFAVTIGAVLGAGAGTVAVLALIGTLPPGGFLIAATVLITLVGVAAAVPPSAIVAWQDPVKTLRVP